MPDKMKVEILEERMRDTDPVTGEFYNCEQGDRITVSAQFGRYLCELGWAKDMAGEVATGERKPGPNRLNVHSRVHTPTSRNGG